MKGEIKEITKVDKQLLNKIEHILASELSCKEYDTFYNYFNEIRKPGIVIDIKDDKNIKDYITNLQKENKRLNSNIECVIDNIKDEIKIIKKMNTKTIEKDYMIGFLNVCIKVLQAIIKQIEKLKGGKNV